MKKIDDDVDNNLKQNKQIHTTTIHGPTQTREDDKRIAIRKNK